MRPYMIHGVVFGLFSVIDMCVTMFVVQRGAEEANPLLAWSLGISMWLFVAIKLGLTVLSSTLLSLIPLRSSFVDRSVVFLYVIYALLFVQHVRVLSVVL